MASLRQRLPRRHRSAAWSDSCRGRGGLPPAAATPASPVRRPVRQLQGPRRPPSGSVCSGVTGPPPGQTAAGAAVASLRQRLPRRDRSAAWSDSCRGRGGLPHAASAPASPVRRLVRQLQGPRWPPSGSGCPGVTGPPPGPTAAGAAVASLRTDSGRRLTRPTGRCSCAV